MACSYRPCEILLAARRFVPVRLPRWHHSHRQRPYQQHDGDPRENCFRNKPRKSHPFLVLFHRELIHSVFYGWVVKHLQLITDPSWVTMELNMTKAKLKDGLCCIKVEQLNCFHAKTHINTMYYYYIRYGFMCTCDRYGGTIRSKSNPMHVRVWKTNRTRKLHSSA